jgi:hypothetical protein
MTLSLLHPVEVSADQMHRLWEAAWLTHRLAELPEVRRDLVARVRAEIESGSYVGETEYAALLDGLIDDIADDADQA